MQGGAVSPAGLAAAAVASSAAGLFGSSGGGGSGGGTVTPTVVSATAVTPRTRGFPDGRFGAQALSGAASSPPGLAALSPRAAGSPRTASPRPGSAVLSAVAEAAAETAAEEDNEGKTKVEVDAQGDGVTVEGAAVEAADGSGYPQRAGEQEGRERDRRPHPREQQQQQQTTADDAAIVGSAEAPAR